MESNNNNWENYVPRRPFRGAYSRNNIPRGAQGNHMPRSNYGGGSNVSQTLPLNHNRQNNPYLHYGNNYGPTHSRHEQQNIHPNYFKSRSFPENRPSPYSRPQNANRRHSENINSRNNVATNLDIDVLPHDPLSAKIDKLLNAVKSQKGILAQLILLETGIDSPTVVLQNAVQSINGTVEINAYGQRHELLINEDKMAEGTFQNKQIAKHSLCEMVVNDLRRKCFYLIKKRNYEEISTDDINGAKKDEPQPNLMEGSKAHQMMLKMGWGGKGLGSKEQGVQETVADTMTRNISKAGLGEKNVMNEIHSILEDFAKSSKVTTLAFDSGFTKDERAHIHKIASKFNLKSKSEGKGDNRRITISKKMAKWDLVKELLLVDCENDSYKLIIPADFENLWNDQ